MNWRQFMHLPRLHREPSVPQLREGFNTYVMHGDIMWGDSITWASRGAPTDDDPNHGEIHGWVLPRPQDGDRLLVKMQTGKWGWWVIHDVELVDTVRDMFFAKVCGAFGYVEGDDEPKLKRASEFVQTGDFIL
jgi:hypothetical protein